MKSKLIICATFLLLTIVSVNVWGQQTTNTQDDGLVRSVMGFDESQYPSRYETPTAQAYHNLLIKAFTNMLPLPQFDFSQLPAGDKATLNNLESELKSLRANPPSWDEITKAEVEKINAETAPPTPPIFAGSAEAERYYSTIKNKNAVKHNPSQPGNYVEQLQDNGIDPKPIPPEPKKEE